MQFAKSEWEPRIGTADFEEMMKRALRSDGFLILEAVMSPSLLARLQAGFGKVLDEFVAANASNRGANRFNTHLYLDGVFADEELVANPIALRLIHGLLGIDAACSWAAADTPLPGSDYQVAHADGRPLFRSHDLSLPVYALAVNFPLVDFTEENGPLEIWGNGTHLLSDVAPHLGAADRPPQRVTMPAGSLMIRDTRMWHRGSPNRSDHARPNLAFVYHRSWYRFEGEAGHTPPAVSAEAYAGWSLATRRLFRFAATDPALTESHRIEMVYRLEALEEEAGLARSRAPMAAVAALA
ncbi:phytanoyl-CoA dioxygenase family protein [Polymorphobacter sp.]|uniref:phytanoyl-CoA dioxygenase family protein n=1 Tax=Polymorphobacter sp. TaxID=1909290 RepID=UPI003F6F6FCB